MRIILSNSTQEAVEAVVSLIFDRIKSHPSSVIGLATGRTMEPVYNLWVNRAQTEKLEHSRCFFFMLDEYLGLKLDHPSSFQSYIKKRVQLPLGLKDSQIAFPPAHLPSAEAGMRYEQLIKESGGIDLQLLGIGQNGHIGFNEPGSDGRSRTRVVDLTPETKAANASQFPGDVMPDRALSMGTGTILESKNLLMLATGSSKADAIKYLVNHHDDPKCPATFLKSHPHFTLVLDPEAAAKISLKI